MLNILLLSVPWVYCLPFYFIQLLVVSQRCGLNVFSSLGICPSSCFKVAMTLKNLPSILEFAYCKVLWSLSQILVTFKKTLGRHSLGYSFKLLFIKSVTATFEDFSYSLEISDDRNLVRWQQKEPPRNKK